MRSWMGLISRVIVFSLSGDLCLRFKQRPPYRKLSSFVNKATYLANGFIRWWDFLLRKRTHPTQNAKLLLVGWVRERSDLSHRREHPSDGIFCSAKEPTLLKMQNFYL